MNILGYIIILASLGIINTAYLSWHAITKTPVYCLFLPADWCKKVQFSSYSKTVGIPNPFLGLGMYSAILILTILFQQQLVPFWPIATIIIIGFVFSLYFTHVQAFIIKAYCTWCVLSAIDFFVLLLLMLRYLTH